jgi:hypothetical protein
MSTEIVCCLIGLAVTTLGGQFALWMRFEHRMTALETRLKLREEIERETHQGLYTKHGKEAL